MKTVTRKNAPTRFKRGAMPHMRQRSNAKSFGAFLRSLKSFDRDLELLWNSAMSRWVLYRIIRRAPTPVEDVLQKEVELCGPNGEMREPGFWLIDWLKRNDVCYQMGTSDPTVAKRRYINDLMRSNEEINVRTDREIDEMSDQWARDLYFAARARNTIPLKRKTIDERDTTPVKTGWKRIIK